MSRHIDALARTVVDISYHLHRDLGPGLLETAYELILYEEIMRKGIPVARQVPVSITYNEIAIPDAFKIDLLVDQQLVVELKAAEKFSPVHARQVLTYLKLANHRVGLLINFGVANFKDAVRRFANGHDDIRE